MRKFVLLGLSLAALAVYFGSGISEVTKTESKPTASDTAKGLDTKTAKLPKILDLGSKSCIPCKAMAPILDSLRQAYKGKADVEFIDVKENRQASIDYKITLIPTQIFFDTTGTEVFRHIGFFPADSIKAHLKLVGARL